MGCAIAGCDGAPSLLVHWAIHLAPSRASVQLVASEDTFVLCEDHNYPWVSEGFVYFLRNQPEAEQRDVTWRVLLELAHPRRQNRSRCKKDPWPENRSTPRSPVKKT